MISHQILKKEIISQLIDKVDKDQHLLFYSYLSQRKSNVVFIGQYVDNQLTAILAFYNGLSFPAFSFYRFNQWKAYLPELIAFTRSVIQIKKKSICGTILNQDDFHLFQSQNLITGTPKRFFTMKHQDLSKLIESNVATEVKTKELSKVIKFLENEKMKFFTKSELEKYPFLGIKNRDEFIAVGGFHFFDPELVELGNILTRIDYRGMGLSKLLTSQLTYIGKKISKEVFLGVLAENLPATNLYKGLGYETTAELSIINFTLD